MKGFLMAVLCVACLGLTMLAGCNRGTKVHTEETRTTTETHPVITGDKPN
jgi:hypothetical protein